MNPDTLRWINVGLSMIVVVLLMMGAIRQWNDLTKGVKRIVPWLLFTYVIIAYGSGEAASAPGHYDPGLRVMLLMLNLAGLAISLIWNMRAPDAGQHGSIWPVTLRRNEEEE